MKDGGQTQKVRITYGAKNGKAWREEDCERMTRTEFEATRCLLGATSYLAHARDDLGKRLECIPGGRQRMNMLMGQVKSLSNAIVDTMTTQQAKQMWNVMKDMDMRMVPKMTPSKTNVLLPVEAAKTLVSSAQHKCRVCVADGEEARKCELYKVLEALTPLDSYGDGLTCPYYLSEIED